MVNPLYDDPCRLLTYSSSLCLINQSQHKYTRTHTRTLADTHVHLPVWIISGFPQWGIECVVCVVCSPLSLTFPSELPNTVGLITHSANAYLSACWQLMCAGFMRFSTNNSKASVTLPPFHQPKQEINLVMSTWQHPPQQRAICGFRCTRVPA